MSRSPTERRVRIAAEDADAVDLCVWEWEGASPSVLLVHATGFHARCWDAVIEQLPGVHCLAVDLRGHGRSSKCGPYGWSRFGDDITELARSCGLRGWLGVGHSLGGHVVTQVAAARPESFTSLLLIDPVILPPEVYSDLPPEFTPDQAHFTARRRRYFESPKAMFQRFEARMPYSEWRPEVLRAYCEYGLEASPEGAPAAYTLACPPEVEAEIYSRSPFYSIYHLLPKVTHPVHVVRARCSPKLSTTTDFSSSPTWPELAAHFPRGRDTHVPELSHFIPMQSPERTAVWIREARDAL